MLTLDHYLSEDQSKQRLDLLASGTKIPPCLARDLLALPLSSKEKKAIIANLDNKASFEAEELLTDFMNAFPSDLGAYMLESFAEKTPGVLWFRLPLLFNHPASHQRIKYKIIEYCSIGSPLLILKTALSSQNPNLEEFSFAYKGLLIRRCLEWNLYEEKITVLAKNILERSVIKTEEADYNHNPIKAFYEASFWLLKYDQKFLLDFISSAPREDPWKKSFQIFSSKIFQSFVFDEKAFLLNILNSRHLRPIFDEKWPSLWERKRLHKEFLSQLILTLAKKDIKSLCDFQSYFLGCDVYEMVEAIKSIEDKDVFDLCLTVFRGFILYSFDSFLFEKIKKFSKQVPSYLVPLLQNDPIWTYSLIEAYTKDHFSEDHSIFPSHEHIVKTKNMSELPDICSGSRKQFFNFYFFGLREELHKDQSIKPSEYLWQILLDFYKDPKEEKIKNLWESFLKQNQVFLPLYIEAMGLLKGSDQGFLKVFNFIREDDPVILSSCIKALDGIATAKAVKELITALQRSHVSAEQKVKISHLLDHHETALFKEDLKAVIYEINTKAATAEEKEIVDNLTHLIDGLGRGEDQNSFLLSETKEFPAALDQQLCLQIQSFDLLPLEVKRALRTAKYFSSKVDQISNIHQIDVSPCIDMQYKALELLYRSYFEQICMSALKKGDLQKKLDLIGYSRGIHSSMERFESYLHQLPIIKQIPYFSLFKLRKMLLSLAAFRSNKRFTLDGIKSFGLFFLVFARKSCPFGLASAFPLHFLNDEELFIFVSQSHLLQDLRNRAVHEGLADHSKAIEEVWALSTDLIEKTRQINQARQAAGVL